MAAVSSVVILTHSLVCVSSFKVRHLKLVICRTTLRLACFSPLMDTICVAAVGSTGRTGLHSLKTKSMWLIWEMSALTLAGMCGSPTAGSKCKSRGLAGSVSLQGSALLDRHQGSPCASLVWVTQSHLPQEPLYHGWWSYLCWL